jgi:hypothetical protein
MKSYVLASVSAVLILALFGEFLHSIPFSKPVAAAENASEREYQIDIGPITGSITANYVYGTLFNPSGSSRTIVVKRVHIRADAVAAANYVNLSLRRITAASAGTLIAAADIPKKNSYTVNPVAEVRHTGVTATFAGAVQSRLMGLAMPGTTGAFYSQQDMTFNSADEKIVLQPGEGIMLYQEAAGDADQRIRVSFEWEEVNTAPTAENEYMLAIQRVEVLASANYVYNSFFNPSGSTKTAVVKRIWFGTETCDTTAIYTNNIVVKRISAASAGTQITAANIPKKNTSSPNSVMDVRHTGVTVTQVGGTDARLGHVTPCGTTAQASGWQELNIHPSDEKIILQPGEGIALVSEAAGDLDQFNRMFIEWDEVASAPAAGNEYLFASNRVENVAVALGTTMYTFFNPSGSGKTMLVRRIGILADADTAATYSVLNFQRITAASGGTLIAAADLPKKHTGSANSAMQVRWCGATCATAITTTYAGARSVAASGLSDSGIFKVINAGNAGQVIGQREIMFGDNEPFVLQEGQGLGFYLNYLAGDLDHYTKVYLEWEEVASAPATQNQYLINIGPVAGNTGTSYNYITFFNPGASGKTAVIKRVSARVDTVAAAVYIPMRLRYISAASAGTLIAAADIPKKHTGSANSAMEIRRTGVTATLTQGTDAQLIGFTTPGAVGGNTLPAAYGYRDMLFANDEEIVLQPGQGVVLQHDTSAGDADHRISLLLEWEEVASGSTPPAEQNHVVTVGRVAGSLATDYVYGTLFNPSGSSKAYLMQRIGIRANRTGLITAPGNIPITIRRITAASGGTQVATADIPKKHTGSTNTTAEIRKAGVTVTLAQAASSRLFGSTAIGAVMEYGDYETEVIAGDELLLLPGEGIALYQEAVAGDANMVYQLSLAWKEITAPVAPQSITFSISDTAIGFGTLLPGSTRYATEDSVGAGSDTTSAHTFSVSTNASGGYVVSLSGTTLTCALCSGATITAIGASAVAPSAGTEQFGVRVGVNSGTGVVSAPYNTANWAFDTAAFPDSLATGAGDEATSVFGVRYMSNIAAESESGSYSSAVTFTATASF